MILKINYLSGIPTYRQIIEGIKEEIALRNLNELDELPSVRNLASQLKVNPNTVARAYRDLIQDGIIFSRQGMGFYIKPMEHANLEFLRESLKKLIIEARVKNVYRKDLEKEIENIIGEIYGK